MNRPRHWLAIAVVFLCALAMLGETARQALRETRVVSQNGDIQLYLRVAGEIGQGKLPYRDFNVEYPPTVPYALALPAGFSAPGGLLSYSPKFVAFIGLVTAGGLVGLVAFARRLGAGWTPLVAASVGTAVAFVAMRSFSVMRYDAVPAVIFALGLGLFLLHWRAPSARLALGAGALLAASAALKLYGIFALVGLGALLVRGRDARELRAYAVGAGLAILPSIVLALMGPSGVRYFLAYHGERHVEIGSLYATIITTLPGDLERTGFSFGSVELRHPSERIFMAIGSVLCLVMAVAPMVLLALRNRRVRVSLETVLFGVALSLMGFIVFNKVFSPQYAIWTLSLAPLFGLAERRRGLAAIAAVTAVALGCGWQLAGKNFMQPVLADIMKTINGKNVIALLAYGIFAWGFARAGRDGLRNPVRKDEKDASGEPRLAG